jgi:DnaJ-class molecular chaperone
VEIIKVIAIEEPEHRKVGLCKNCRGQGWVWSELEFGDIPGDERKCSCTACNGAGRTTALTITVEAVVPFDFKVG